MQSIRKTIRTLAMTAYADLDVSVIDELPPGRMPVQTVAIGAARREEVIERIRHACSEGRQAYWVCTLIEESELLEAQAAEAPAPKQGRAEPQSETTKIFGAMAKSAAHAIGSQIGRQIIRGVLGSILGGSGKRR